MSNRKLPTQIGQGIVFRLHNSIRGGVRDEQNRISSCNGRTFEVSERSAREGRNPQTGEPMKIDASKAPKFKAGKALKDEVNR